jgi:predicted phosphodiesterase
MRILILSDIHANLTALEAVLADAGPVDQVWCLGDLVGYGPDPNECIAILKTIPNLKCILGNHDAAALGRIDLETFNQEARFSARWMQNTLNSSSMDFLKRLPEKIVIENVTLAHGSPRNPVWEYILDVVNAAENFKFFDTQICLVGHTHLPVAYINPENRAPVRYQIPRPGEVFPIQQRMILNPGSVGQPRDHDPRAAYAILDLQEQSWQPQRVVYDISSVQTRIRDAGLPPRHAQRLMEGW